MIAGYFHCLTSLATDGILSNNGIINNNYTIMMIIIIITRTVAGQVSDLSTTPANRNVSMVALLPLSMAGVAGQNKCRLDV